MKKKSNAKFKKLVPVKIDEKEKFADVKPAAKPKKLPKAEYADYGEFWSDNCWGMIP
jgi:hypothetical protein